MQSIDIAPTILDYLGVEIPPEDFKRLPGLSGWDLIQGGPNGQPPEAVITTMLEESLNFAVNRSATQPPDILLLKDGPYGIPELEVRGT